MNVAVMNPGAQKRGAGLTLVELLVIVALVSMLAAIIGVYQPDALLKGRITATAANGKSIHAFIERGWREMEVRQGPTPAWPKFGRTRSESNQYTTSTDFFIDMVTQGLVAVDFAFFAVPYMNPGPQHDDAAAHPFPILQPQENGWCIVGNVDDSYPDTAPVLFTSNLRISSMDAILPEKDNWLSEAVLPRDKQAPFHGRDAFVFVTKKGQAFGFLRDQLGYETFTNLFEQVATNGARLTNPILRP